MRSSKLYAPTLKEIPSDAEVISHQILVRGGYIRKLTAGIYDYLPLARRILSKIERIIRQELDGAGAQEVLLPIVQPSTIWEESGRWQKYGPELLRMVDRKGSDFCLGPTHEEVIVDLVRRDVRSWKMLPLNLYQIQAKFRDEIRPRAGLMRGREFIMKDAYSFDLNEENALKTYEEMYQAYQRIFSRCGLDFRAVEADTGAIGGSRSHEFQVLAESGEDAIVSCGSCDYAANVEQAHLHAPKEDIDLSLHSPQRSKVHTPQLKKIEDVSAFLNVETRQCAKMLILKADEDLIAVLVRGDHELNEIKVKKYLNADVVEMAEDAEIKAAFGLEPGFLGPYQLPQGAVSRILADHFLCNGTWVVGANEVDFHYTGVSLEKDTHGVDPDGKEIQVEFADFRMAQQGDTCPQCGGELNTFKGIEVGHVFYLGTKYSEAMKCTVLNDQTKEVPMVMGCYGIGVSRVMAAAVEQYGKDSSMCWPLSIAPYQVHILALQSNVEEVMNCGEKLYQQCKDAGIEVLFDDRSTRAGAKFKDADLIGIPLRVSIGGRGLKEGIVELKVLSQSDEIQKVAVDEIFERLQSLIQG